MTLQLTDIWFNEFSLTHVALDRKGVNRGKAGLKTGSAVAAWLHSLFLVAVVELSGKLVKLTFSSDQNGH